MTHTNLFLTSHKDWIWQSHRFLFKILSINYMCKNKIKQYNDNKRKITAPSWNDEFELLHGSYSMSDVQDNIEYIAKHYIILNGTLPTIPTIPIYFNKINNRLVFKIKDRYKLELHTRKIWNYLVAQKIDTKNKKWEKMYQVLKWLKER